MWRYGVFDLEVGFAYSWRGVVAKFDGRRASKEDIDDGVPAEDSEQR